MTDAPAPKVYLPLYKKWTRFKDNNYFATFGFPWFAHDKLAIEVGASSQGKLTGVTKVYVNGFEFASWLHAFVAGHAPELVNGKNFVHYGGAMVDGQPVSRALNVTPHNKDGVATGRSVLAVAHLVGVRTETGAFMPKQPNEQISYHSIQLTPGELRELSYRLDHCYSGYYAALFLGQGDNLHMPTEEPSERTPTETDEPRPGELF